MSCLTLPPGYTLLERSGDIVLAFNPNSPCGRYATWKVDRTGTGVHSGFYLCDIRQAVKNFVSRAKLDWDISPDRVNAS